MLQPEWRNVDEKSQDSYCTEDARLVADWAEMHGNSERVWKVVFRDFVWVYFWFIWFFAIPDPRTDWGNWQLALILWLLLKLMFANVIYFSFFQEFTSSYWTTPFLKSFLFGFVLIRETSAVAFLLILPELICFAGKEYVHVPDPTPGCIPSATKRKKIKTEGEKHISHTLAANLTYEYAISLMHLWLLLCDVPCKRSLLLPQPRSTSFS